MKLFIRMKCKEADEVISMIHPLVPALRRKSCWLEENDEKPMMLTQPL